MPKVLFLGNFLAAGNATGESPDERHMARDLGRVCDVTTQDHAEWVAHVDGHPTAQHVPQQDFDIILIVKWVHYTEKALQELKSRYKGKLVFLCWDYMWSFHKGVDYWCPDWFKMMLRNCDVYLSHELGMAWKYRELGVNWRYFSWDTADGEFDQIFKEGEKHEKYDVVFPGTFVDQPRSERVEILRYVKESLDLTVFSYDFEKWREEGFKAEPGLYGEQFRELSRDSRVIISMNSVPLRPETYGYWSNRNGKITTTGGLPLIQYVPGMERVFGDRVTYFYTKEDLVQKAKWFLDNPPQRETARVLAYDMGRRDMTTLTRMKQLKVVLESVV